MLYLAVHLFPVVNQLGFPLNNTNIITIIARIFYSQCNSLCSLRYSTLAPTNVHISQRCFVLRFRFQVQHLHEIPTSTTFLTQNLLYVLTRTWVQCLPFFQTDSLSCSVQWAFLSCFLRSVIHLRHLCIHNKDIMF